MLSQTQATKVHLTQDGWVCNDKITFNEAYSVHILSSFLMTLFKAENFDTRWQPAAVQWFGSQHHTAHIRPWLCQPQHWESCTSCQDGEWGGLRSFWHYVPFV